MRGAGDPVLRNAVGRREEAGDEIDAALPGAVTITANRERRQRGEMGLNTATSWARS